MSVKLRDIVRKQMEANASMNALMNETLNIGGSLLVKLFGRQSMEVDRFSRRADQVKDYGIIRTRTVRSLWRSAVYWWQLGRRWFTDWAVIL